MEKISWTDRVRNGEVLYRVMEERNIIHTLKRRKANWIGHSMRRNRVLKDVTEGIIEGGVEVTRKREEDVSSYWMTLRKREDTRKWKRKH